MTDSFDSLLMDTPDQDINIKTEYIFGIRKDLLPNFYCIDQDFIVYAAANYIIVYNHTLKYNRKPQQFIAGAMHSNGIKIMTVAKYSKPYIFFVEDLGECKMKVNIYSLITINPNYNLPTKVFEYTFPDDPKITEVYCIASSYKETGSIICMPIKTSDFQLVFWKWEFENLKDINMMPVILPKVDYNFVQVKFCFEYNKMEHFCLYTDAFFVYFSYNDQNLTKLFQYSDIEGKIYDACWLFDGKWAVVTSKKLLIFNLEQEKIVTTINLVRENCQITGIVTIYDSIILTGTKKRLEFWEMKQDYDRIFSTNFESYPDFDFFTTSFPSGTSEKAIVATTNNNDVFLIDCEKYIQYNDDKILSENNIQEEIKKQIEKRDKNSLKALLPSFHTDSVDALDLCINKPYFISGSKDKSLRIYDFKEKKLHLIKTYLNEEILAVTFHPSGNYAIVSNEERLRPVHIFYDVIENMTQNGIPSKKSKEVRFSNGGHLFSFEAGNRIEIWNFLTMQLHQSLKFVFATNRINSVFWREDDKYIGICANESLYDWKIAYENQPQNRLHAKNHSFLTASFVKKSNNFISISDDSLMRLFSENDNISGQNKFEDNVTLKEAKLLKNSRHFIAACNSKDFKTSCLRVFKNLQSTNYEHDEFVGHLGEITRVRVNIQENLIFTSGTDGSIIMFSAYGGSDLTEEDRERNAEISIIGKMTNIVTIKKTMLSEKLQEMDTIPQKQEELLKKIRSRIQDDKEFLHKENDKKKNKLSTMKQSEQKETSQKQFELDQLNLDSSHDIETDKTNFSNDLENTRNMFQIELSDKQRLIEDNRSELKEYRDNNVANLQNKMKISDDNLNKIKEINETEVNKAGKLQSDLQNHIDTLNKEKELNDQTMDWLNGRVLEVLTNNINELKNGIEDMNVQNANQVKKLKETIAQKNQDSDNLERELKSLEEEKHKGENTKGDLLEAKKKNEEELRKIQENIQEVEKMIIGNKKKNQYLDKCKFVLDYKIKELRREMGPIEKTIEELKAHTKELDMKLKKFNREHDLIDKKLVDFKDLQQNMVKLENQLRKEKADIQYFKNVIFNMIYKIDDSDFIIDQFKHLKDRYLVNYAPETVDKELEAEFINQEDNMNKKIFDISRSCDLISKKQAKEMTKNREANFYLISQIENLTVETQKERQRLIFLAADTTHEKAMAAIFAQKSLNKHFEKEFEDVDEEEEYLNELIEQKNRKLRALQGNDSVVLPGIIKNLNE